MAPRPSRLSEALARARPGVFSAFCIVAAFGTYFCMYAFRKPFTAGTFEDVTLWGIGYKPVLVAAQLLGYTLSKFIGIKVVSEMPAARRAGMILILIGIAEAALLLFALVPAPYNFGLLFLNGLPLGMVFGLVLSFLEGRQLTEALTAGLCASFIVSGGVVKSVGRTMILDWGISEYWMPFLTGLVFAVPLVLSVALLRHIPPPTKVDVAKRAPRKPMYHRQRAAFFRRHAAGLIGLFLAYVLLTVMRTLRGDFAVEIWDELGEGGKPAIFAKSEALVMIGVVIVNGAAIRIRNHRLAFLSTLCLIAGGFLFVLLALAGQHQGWLSPFAFMVLSGFGMYVPYVAFHTTLFERLLSSLREPANLGFLMYFADSVGYLGVVGVLAARSLTTDNLEFLPLFLTISLVVAVTSIAIVIWLYIHFRARLPQGDRG
jgi:hypothetical protein